MQGLGPAGDDLADTKGDRLAAVVGGIELGAVDQGALVVALDPVVGRGRVAFAGLERLGLGLGVGVGVGFRV